MLYIFVDKEQSQVYYATYNKDSMEQFCRYKQVELTARYWDDVEIYEIKENYESY